MICRLAAAAGAAALMMVFAPGAQAKELPAEGLTAAEVRTWLADSGEDVKLTKGSDGLPMLTTDVGGVTVNVYLYDCVDEHCASIQFSAGLDLDKPISADKINTWNREKRYVHAYTDEEGDPYFNYDVNLAPGGTYEALDDHWAIYLSMLPDVRALVGWD